jgi:hypothetical protein
MIYEELDDFLFEISGPHSGEDVDLLFWVVNTMWF